MLENHKSMEQKANSLAMARGDQATIIGSSRDAYAPCEKALHSVKNISESESYEKR